MYHTGRLVDSHTEANELHGDEWSCYIPYFEKMSMACLLGCLVNGFQQVRTNQALFVQSCTTFDVRPRHYLGGKLQKLVSISADRVAPLLRQICVREMDSGIHSMASQFLGKEQKLKN